jgi:hypothetical protein
MTTDEFMAEYMRLGHAIQTGVAYEMNNPERAHATEPKYLRTGLNGVMSDLGSIGRLLIAKGVFTEAEYFEAILEGLRMEVAAYEQRLNAQFGGGTRITLG